MILVVVDVVNFVFKSTERVKPIRSNTCCFFETNRGLVVGTSAAFGRSRACRIIRFCIAVGKLDIVG